MIGVNMQTSFLTPPFGFALFYLRGVAPAAVRTVQMYVGVVPFILLQLAGLAIVGLWPGLVNYLPNRVYLTSETAPPPKNPRLQHCVEEMLFRQYGEQEDSLSQAIASARKLDLSYLPGSLRSKILDGFENAEQTFTRVEKVEEAEVALRSYVPLYEPVHHTVRRIQGRARRMNELAAEVQDEIRQLERDGLTEGMAELREQLEEIQDDVLTLGSDLAERLGRKT